MGVVLDLLGVWMRYDDILFNILQNVLAATTTESKGTKESALLLI
jgi:hypothetical protein